MVEREHAQPFSYNGKRYKIALQDRVGHLKIISASETGVGADYWPSPSGDDGRPYGILIREVRQTKSQTWVQFNRFSTVRAAQSAQPNLQIQLADSTCSLQ